MNSRLIPFLPHEITALVVSPENFSPAEAAPLCLISKCWRELGQAIVWRQLRTSQQQPRAFDSARIVLFESDEVGSRLGRYIKKLVVYGCFDFTNGTDENGPVDMPTVIGKTLRSFEFVVEGCRKMLKLCTRLENLEFINIHPVALRAILETATASPMRTSLKSFKWNQSGLGTVSYPLDLSPVEFLSQLSRFDELEILDIDIILASKRSIFGSSRPPLPLPLPFPSLPLVSLIHTIRLVFEEAESDDEHDTEASEEFVASLLRCANKETLHELTFEGPMPFDPVCEQLRRPGLHLTSLGLRCYHFEPTTLLNTVAAILPFHQQLSALHILAPASQVQPQGSIAAPRSFLDALPRGLKFLSIRVVVDKEEDWAKEIMRGPLGATLQSFLVLRSPNKWEQLIERRIDRVA